MEIHAITALDMASTLRINIIVNFIFNNQVGSRDTKINIYRSVEYALSPYKYQGGFVLLAEKNKSILGSVVVNRTNMEGYVPKNLMVYLAADPDSAIPDFEKILLSKVIQLTSSELACHITVDNPAMKIFEDVGFKKKFFEMRLKR